MVLEQEAALLRELMAIVSGSSNLSAAPGDRRFTDPAWQHNPLYRICLQTYLAWTNSVAQFVDQLPDARHYRGISTAFGVDNNQ